MRAWTSLQAAGDATSEAERAALDANVALGEKNHAAASVRGANLARLSSLPTFASLFKPDDDQTKQRELTKGFRDPDPPGFDDALRVYFNALRDVHEKQ